MKRTQINKNVPLIDNLLIFKPMYLSLYYFLLK